jgi:integrase
MAQIHEGGVRRTIPNYAQTCGFGSTNAPDGPAPRPTPHYCSTGAGSRLSTRAASSIFRAIVIAGGLDDQITAHTGRHTFATTLIRGGTDLVLVAEMVGHARLETVRAYTRPTAEDRVKALNLLPTDR